MASDFRIAIVGSGPAGLSAAARAAELGLSHVLLEKSGHLSDTIQKYQKGKHIMATPPQLEKRSPLQFEEGVREKVLSTWEEQAEAAKVNVAYNAEIVEITGEKGNFTLKARSGRTITAETVVLAIGTQGNPNLLRCPIEPGSVVQYQLDDASEYHDEHIVVIGAGDAGIENALGLAAEPTFLRNKVTIVNKDLEFATAKKPNIASLLTAERDGRITVLRKTTTKQIDKGSITFDTPNGELKQRCDRVIARIGSMPPRGFVRACCGTIEDLPDPARPGEIKKVVAAGTGIEFTSDERASFPALSQTFESTVPGIYVIGALASYPLIKHCVNQGYDVIEYINGNTGLKPADEPLLEKKFSHLPGHRSVDDWLAFMHGGVAIFKDMALLQMREFMLESNPVFYRKGETVFERNAEGSSLFAIADGSVLVEVDPKDRSKDVEIPQGSIVGEVGLISGRKRGATVRAASDSILVEIPRIAALELMVKVPAAGREIARISIERQLLQMLRPLVTPEDLADIIADIDLDEIQKGKAFIKAGEAVVNEGEEGNDIFIVRQGSMVVEKDIGGKPVFLSYLPAGTYFGEMALIDGGRRTATVRAAIKSQVVRLNGDKVRALLDRKPELLAAFMKVMRARRDVTAFIEERKQGFGGVIDMFSSVARFLIDEEGAGDATDLLLIDEKLCIGCDNCERACADAHEGLSRLNREAGKTFAHLHVPTSCRHCEHPHCMADCPTDAIHRGQDGEVDIDAEKCIGCGYCQRSCPYGVIRMEQVPPPKPNLLLWLLGGLGPGPGEPPPAWTKKRVGPDVAKKAIKCDMCGGIDGGPACVRACPTGAAIRVAPEEFLTVARLAREG